MLNSLEVAGMENGGNAGVKSADRTLRLIEFVADHGEVGFNAILHALQLPRSSGHGLIQTLVSSGWIAHDPGTRMYSLGLRAWQVGQRYVGHRTLVDSAGPIMERLVDEIHETVQIARLDGLENVYIAVHEANRPMRIASTVGSRLDAHATGIGKALLSMLDRDELIARLREAQPLRSFTPTTVTTLDELVAKIDRVRTDGYALDDEEAISGVRCVAVPLTAESGAGLLSAISITMPTSRTDASWPDGLLEPLRSAAADIRRVLGRETASSRTAPV